LFKKVYPLAFNAARLTAASLCKAENVGTPKVSATTSCHNPWYSAALNQILLQRNKAH
jgi:hypothetical protein